MGTVKVRECDSSSVLFSLCRSVIFIVMCSVWAWQLGWAEVWDILNNLRVAIFKCVIKHSAVMDTVKTKVLFN